MNDDKDLEKEIQHIIENRHMSSCTGGYKELAVKETKSLVVKKQLEVLELLYFVKDAHIDGEFNGESDITSGDYYILSKKSI